jgi:TRAP-type C4-dicarboxylate transport system substrate-binding protein
MCHHPASTYGRLVNSNRTGDTTMRTRRGILLALACAASVAATSAAPVLAQDKGGGERPVTLSLAVWDQPGRQAEQAALDLVALAPELSGGAITITEPLWGAADAADLVRFGQVDLAILATREWSPLGVTSLDALEAPFLIDTDELALAVATSGVADMAMAGLDALGVKGLAMWPEDHRHLFAFGAFGRAFTTPEDFDGATILGIAGTYGKQLITSLGGKLYEELLQNDTQTGDRVLDSQSGALDGMVTGLWGAGLSTDQIADATVAGDVVLYPKYQVLVANHESLARLSDEQRDAIDSIVAEVHRLALERHFTEAELAAGICEIGGTVVEAGPEALESLKSAAAPLSDEMAADPVMGDIIDSIDGLAAVTPRGPGAGTCAPASPRADATAEVAPVPDADLAGHSGTELPPNGTYRAAMVGGDMAAAGASANYAAINDGIWTMIVEGDTWQVHHDRNNERCSGSLAIVDGNVRLATIVSQGCGMDYDVRWRLDGDALSLRLADLPWAHTATDLANERVFIDRVWTRIDEPTAADAAQVVPPDGVYRADITVEDLEARGIDRDSAVGNAGVVTLTLQGTDGAITWESGAVAGYTCTFTTAADDGSVRLVLAGDDCDTGEYVMSFAVDGEQLRPTVISTTPAGDLELTRAFFEREWTRIRDSD